MIAKQIVIKGDERSEEYAEISRNSFQPLVDEGIIEIETFDAITPESPEYEEHHAKYTWAKSLMFGDTKQGKGLPMHSPSEMAGMCSHWELMRQQSLQDERFLVLEHDTWFHGDVRYFKECLEMDVLYLNIGLFMGCYAFERETAQYQYELLSERDFPINCGPYCCLQRLFATYSSRVLQFKEEKTCLVPWHHCDTLYLGNDCQIPFNGVDPNRQTSKSRVPTTQVISKRLKVTQDHHSYKESFIDEPWTRHDQFHIIP